MPRVGIRVTDDAAVVAALRRAWTEEDAGPVGDPDFETRFAAWFDEESMHRTFWVASVEDDPIGLLAMAEYRRMPRPGRDTGRWGYVANLFVTAAHRNGGVGRQLLDVAVAEARRRGYVRLVLSPAERALPFYRRAGFVDAADELLVLPLAGLLADHRR